MKLCQFVFILPRECHSATLSLINLAMKAISAVLGCLNYQQLSDTELAEQRYTLMVFPDFYALEFGFFKENMFII